MMEGERIRGTDVQRRLPDSRCRGSECVCAAAAPSLEVMGEVNMDGGV